MAEACTDLISWQTVPFNGHVFKVEKVDKHRIKQIRLEKGVSLSSG